MSKLTESIQKGREDFKKEFQIEHWPSGYEWPIQDPAAVLAFLNQYTTSLLQAIKEAGPESFDTTSVEELGSEYAAPRDYRRAGHNFCLAEFHSLLDEGIEASKH